MQNPNRLKRIVWATAVIAAALLSACCPGPRGSLKRTTWDSFDLASDWKFEYINFTFVSENEIKATFLEYDSPNRHVSGTYSYDAQNSTATVLLDGDTLHCTIRDEVLRYTGPDSVRYTLRKRSRYHKPDF